MPIKEKTNAYIADTYARFDVALTGGQGALLTGEDGKTYIDLGSGIAVNVFGAADEKWVEAVTTQAKRLPHTSNLYYTAPQADLAQLLCEKAGMKRVFFGNSGAEANECAIKVARKYGQPTNRSTIVTLYGSFHGRTLATLAATGQDVFHTQFQPLPAGFKHVPPNDLKALENALDGSVCAVMVEFIQGEGGVNVLDAAYVKAAAQLLKERDILLIADEVQTGLGRTGELFAYTHFNVLPDVVTSAKGLGGGLPIGACLMGERVKDVFTPSDHGSTFGGNPICASGALSVVERMTPALYQGVKEREAYIKEALKDCPGVKGITGMGLMLGIQTETPARVVVERCLKKGVLVLTAKDKVRLLPPLNIEWEQLKKGIAVLKEAF